ncbi:unnamed protein product [Spirodela intermedia]|uniref:Uncharacterized protein n=1 Tax=Spirodela intermedia TaxID=51605 RepID=A0A7I8IH21_SPIIN|nr:unnamed protein product [Spirodela intermedia]CAA6656594.1 unnamed protein product [Spirodela intermedia]
MKGGERESSGDSGMGGGQRKGRWGQRRAAIVVSGDGEQWRADDGGMGDG